MATNDFLVFGGGAGANVMSQADWLALAQRLSGFQSGIARSEQLNKAWRQSSIMAAVLGQFIADRSGADVIDDGSIATILANLKASVAATNGDATEVFSVDTATADAHAVPLLQLQQNYAWHHKIDIVAASGDYTVPAGVYKLDVELWGGGGGGGGTATVGSSGPGGGGGGGYARKIVAVTPGQVIACTVGTGGAGGGGGGYGGNAGTTSFGVSHSATGGQGGAPNSVGGGGAAGTGTGGDINSNGSPGGGGHASGYSGGGGGAPFGGPGGNGASGAAAGGALPGGGGPGRGTSSVGSGGAGAPGLIIIRY